MFLDYSACFDTIITKTLLDKLSAYDARWSCLEIIDLFQPITIVFFAKVNEDQTTSRKALYFILATVRNCVSSYERGSVFKIWTIILRYLFQSHFYDNICVLCEVLQCTKRGDKLSKMYERTVRNLFQSHPQESNLFRENIILKLEDTQEYICIRY